MSERQRGLGRGLSALLGEQVAESAPVDGTPAPAGVRLAPIESLKPNPDQPRKTFGQEELDELAASIRDKGVLQPVLVRSQPGEDGVWQIIAGERRWRAAQQARLTEIPIIIKEMDDVAVFEVAIIENVQRADLNPLEEAEAFRVLMERFGRSQDAVAGVVGKSRSHVANTLRLLQLPDRVLNYLRHGKLSAGHARALINTPNPGDLADVVYMDGLSVRQTEALARRAIEGPRPGRARGAASSPGPGSADVAALEQDLADALGLKVQLADRNGKGELTLRYGSLEQLDDLCRRLMRG
ncbi:MAG: ParB/RepB/Spo0J family partition protein [Brevundimonas sp.]|uniref:ParB/RepB/Spo0J family partition protein n=1 Tax=Brevundimonas sp. TaxID=1871086 RepID=UPI002718D570|nr:ParB/RepB/Spo0J family partition protein [Brevundimonas sp.]MDO9586553.1 ParB/RepB/Spo0J family partition protein [Brevundimonas sp.]MDP3657484.1 ParB/RepB/Spo0J family partition protein [Brevundimonas sp.]MDZ4112554.1 ParB/RepB/Spo0J family partition protein [Brevundimonas sp.]